MKNKLVTKIIMVVVSVSTLFATFVVPSFAYTITNSSSIYNTMGETFNLPGFNALNLKNVSSQSDIPDTLTFPIADYFGRTSNNTLGAFSSTIDNNNSVTWYLSKQASSVNYYSTGYLQDANIMINSVHNYPFNYYELSSIVLRDYSFSSPDDVVSGPTCSVEIDLNDPELFEQFSGVVDGNVYSLKVNYDYKYYDQDGDFHEWSFDTKVYPTDVGDNVKRFSLQYFPDRYYVNLGDGFITDDTALNPIYHHKLVYLEELVITIDMDGYDLNFMNPDNKNLVVREYGHFINRLNPSNSFSVGDLLEGSFDLGYTRGKSDGFSAGFQSAVDQGELNPFENVLNMINTFINWEFIPGVSIGVVLSIVIGVSLLIAFLKIFAGG